MDTSPLVAAPLSPLDTVTDPDDPDDELPLINDTTPLDDTPDALDNDAEPDDDMSLDPDDKLKSPPTTPSPDP